MRQPARQRGAALILVLWMVVGLSLVVLAGAQSARMYTQRVGLELEQIRSDAALEAATELVLSVGAAGAQPADDDVVDADYEVVDDEDK